MTQKWCDLRLQGPFGAPAQRVWEFKTVMVVGAGIGVSWHRNASDVSIQPGMILSMSFIFFQVQTPNIFSRPFWNFEFSIFNIFQLKLVSSASGHTIRLDLAIRADAKAAAAPSQSIRPGSNSPCSVDSAFCVSVSGASGDVEAKSPKRHARCHLIQKDFGSEAKGSRNLHYEII